MKNKLIVIVLSALLIASITTNIILITKLNKPTTDTTTIENKDTDKTSDLIGIYYNNEEGQIEFKDSKTLVNHYGFEYSYTIEGKDITFTYYTDLSKDENGKCWGIENEKLVEVPNCKQKRTLKGKVVNNGVIFNNKLYYKIG